MVLITSGTAENKKESYTNMESYTNRSRFESEKLLLRSLVENVYDAQSVRIAMGNRLVMSLRNMGVIAVDPTDPPKKKKASTDPANVEEEGNDKDREEKENNKLLVKVLKEFELVSEVYATRFNNKGSIQRALDSLGVDSVYIKTELTYNMISSFNQMVATEQRMITICGKEVQKHQLWNSFFKDVKGCGPMMAAVCLAYLDPYKARYASSFWKYCGLDVIVDENGSHGRTNHDYIMVEYTNKNGEVAERKSISYNPVIKTKLVGVLGSSFLRAGKEAHYAKVYYDYKNRLLNREDCQSLRPVVIHRRAIRYAVKMFLQDLWVAWRTLEGLPVGDSYAVAKLGMAPHHDPRLGKDVTDEDVVQLALNLGSRTVG